MYALFLSCYKYMDNVPGLYGQVILKILMYRSDGILFGIFEDLLNVFVNIFTVI